MTRAPRARMRLSPVVAVAAAFPLFALGTARANPHTSGGSGGGGGGGALSHVSEGMRDASSAGGSSSGGSSHDSGSHDTGGTHECCYEPSWESRGYVTTGYVVGGYGPGSAYNALPDPGPAHVRLYAGAQQVHDSDGSVSLELAIEDRWFRVGGTVTRYFERQDGADMLTMTLPTLTGGVRLPTDLATRVYAEAGLTTAWTDNDPVMDTTLKGGLVGLRVEHRLGADSEFIADAQMMFFNHDVKANAGRIGVRFGHLQASLRVLDFNIGPALYGPELGVAF